MRWVVALVVVAVLAAPALGQAPVERAVSFVAFHAWPDPAGGSPRADPFASARASGAHVADGARLPVTLVDGVARAAEAPDGDPSDPGARFQEVRELVRARAAQGAPLVARLDARFEGDSLLVDASFDGEAPPFVVRAVVVEDGLAHAGGNGVTVHRFVARLELEERAAENASWGVALDPAWDRSRLGVVVHARAAGEVLQSASWLATQSGPTVQRDRAVLVEHLTASWCEPCGASDAALALLAAQNGFPLDPRGGAHAFQVTPLLLAGLAGGAGLGVVVARRRLA